MIRIMLVDDHQVVRMGLRAMLSIDSGLEVVAEASNAEECLELYDQVCPNVVLLDIRMRPLNGIETLIAIRKLDPTAKVIMLTTSDLREDVWQAVSNGAVGYLLKDAEPEVIIEAIRKVVSGGTVYPPEVRRYLDVHHARPALSARQLDVLRLMAKGKQNREIADAMAIAEGTVKSYIKELFAKLEVNCRAEAVAKGLSQGIIDLSSN